MKKVKLIKPHICDDLFFEILLFLTFSDICSFKLVSKRFNETCMFNYLWKCLIERNYPDGYKIYPEKKNNYLIFKDFYIHIWVIDLYLKKDNSKETTKSHYESSHMWVKLYKSRLNPNIWEKKHLLIEAVKRNGLIMEFASKELQYDKEVVLAAVKTNGQALRFASEELQNDKEVVLAAVKQNGRSLQNASEELRYDKEVVLAAVKNDGEALFSASPELKNDKQIVYEAYISQSRSLVYASLELKKNRPFLFSLIKENTPDDNTDLA